MITNPESFHDCDLVGASVKCVLCNNKLPSVCSITDSGVVHCPIVSIGDGTDVSRVGSAP